MDARISYLAQSFNFKLKNRINLKTYESYDMQPKNQFHGTGKYWRSGRYIPVRYRS